MSVATLVRSTIANTLLVVFSSVITLAFAEVGIRLYLGKLFSTEMTRSNDVQVVAGPRAVFDSKLGWIPKAGTRVGEFSSTIGEYGIRVHGPAKELSPTPYALAVGDSFTFGDGVDDDQTWPAHLEERIGLPVLNGGVFGYGVDQTVLRAQSLLEIYHPKLLIVSMIADDLKRNELAYRYGWKPYFEIVEGTLTLRNVPVPELPSPARYRNLRNTLGYSYLANGVFRRLAPNWWHHQGVEQRVHQQGTEVAIQLMSRISEMVAGRDIRVIIVGQADRTLDALTLKPVSESAEHHGLEALDLATPLVEQLSNATALDATTFLGPFAGHMTPSGNAWVAEKIAEHLSNPVEH